MDYEKLLHNMHMQAYREFITAVAAGRHDFILLLEPNTYFIFMSRYLGAAKLYYVATCYDVNAMVDETMSFRLAAICNDTNIFMMDRYLFRETDYSPIETVIYINDYVEKVNSEGAAWFPDFIRELKPRKDRNRREPTHAEIRKYILQNAEAKPENQTCLHTRDVINAICDGIDPVQRYHEALLRQADYYANQKALCEQLNQSVTEKKGVEDWEIDLYQALNQLKSMRVTVEFVKNCRSAHIKADRESLMQTLVDKQTFSWFSFPNGAEAAAMFKHTLKMKDDPHLSCSDIKSVSFRGKTIFERKLED